MLWAEQAGAVIELLCLVAPEPVLAGLEATDHRMPRVGGVLTRVLRGRGVTAADVAAGLAQRRRWSHQPSAARQSTQPVARGGTEGSIAGVEDMGPYTSLWRTSRGTSRKDSALGAPTDERRPGGRGETRSLCPEGRSIVWGELALRPECRPKPVCRRKRLWRGRGDGAEANSVRRGASALQLQRVSSLLVAAARARRFAAARRGRELLAL